MNQIKLPQQKPGAPPRPSDRRPLRWAVITGLTAAVALGFMAPRLVGHGHAHASVSPLQAAYLATPSGAAASRPAPSAATWGSTVPAASDVFANPESGAVVSAPPPTF